MRCRAIALVGLGLATSSCDAALHRSDPTWGETDAGLTHSSDASQDAPDANPGTDASQQSTNDTGTHDPDAGSGIVFEEGCAPLAAPVGTIIRVRPEDADSLPGLVRDAAPGTTFLLEDGTYQMSLEGESNRRIQVLADDITIRSANDDATRVILDAEYRTNEAIYVYGSNVTLAHFTITHAVDHAVHVSAPEGGHDISGTVLYGMRFIDEGEQFVKINAAEGHYADDGAVACSYFELTDAGRPNIERVHGGCYTGGVDAHSARGWRVANNRFEDIYCAGEGLAEHAIHFWSASRDTLVENNVILNCARGIGFGLIENGMVRNYSDDPYPGVGYIGHYDGIIRNNFIYANIDWYDTGIELAQARGSIVAHNTIFSTQGASYYSGIDARFANTSVTLINNIADRITRRDGGQAIEMNNIVGNAQMFIDGAAGDLHLRATASEAIDRGASVAVGIADDDIDQDARVGARDIGADEL